ncbi:MAG: glucose-6-phosphate isomerase [Betaproteobacteria bacterium]|nr:MAG: glucose-6-phosphate isomerase [Betaproteobacteria bacterium]
MRAFPTLFDMSSVPDLIAGAARALRRERLIDLFANDRSRVPRMTLEWGDWRVDFSKERLTPDALALLVAHAEASNVPHWVAALFAGEKINLSEGRPALHTALRQRNDTPLLVDGHDVIPDIRATQSRMRDISQTMREGGRIGATGLPLNSVVHIGIGGSDLGPRLVCDAISAGPRAIDVSFVSNVDPEHLSRALADRDPATTLFIVVSKTFTTQETLANALSARGWLSAALPPSDVGRHFIGVTANVAAAAEFGIVRDNVLPMWDWVGGRYSLWSAVGLSIAIRHGYETFDELLAGAAAMDAHVRETPAAKNLAIVLGLIGWWNACALGHTQRIVVPYAQALARLPAFLQQLTLESNGKRVTRDGAPVDGPTAPALWGHTGTDGQHAFFQWLHQGTHEVPVEFIVPVRATHSLGDQQTLLVANAVAQSQALLVGRRGDELRRELAQQGSRGAALEAAIAARECPGNRASTTLLLPKLDAHNLGALLALYEHRTFVESILTGINAFDQWGVELGKSLAKPIVAALAENRPLSDSTDPSTRALIEHVRALKRTSA